MNVKDIKATGHLNKYIMKQVYSFNELLRYKIKLSLTYLNLILLHTNMAWYWSSNLLLIRRDGSF